MILPLLHANKLYKNALGSKDKEIKKDDKEYKMFT
jgi:hypothetical protein